MDYSYKATMSEPSLSVSNPVLDLPPSLVLEVALGADPVESICAQYGYDEERTAAIRSSKHFWKIVKEQEAELDKNGLSFRLRAKRVTEDMIGRLWLQAKTDAVPFAAKLDFLKTAAKLADLEPKATQITPGVGFSITFNLGGAEAQITQTKTLNHEELYPLPELKLDPLKSVITYSPEQVHNNSELDYTDPT